MYYISLRGKRRNGGKGEKNSLAPFDPFFPLLRSATQASITCTVHRTVISVEHFAIASAGFFVLLASFAVQRKK